MWHDNSVFKNKKRVKVELKSYNSLCSIHFPNNGVETFYKISKQWNGIFYSIPLHSIAFHSAPLRSVPSIQTEPKSCLLWFPRDSQAHSTNGLNDVYILIRSRQDCTTICMDHATFGARTHYCTTNPTENSATIFLKPNMQIADSKPCHDFFRTSTSTLSQFSTLFSLIEKIFHGHNHKWHHSI